jgi:hypothetical protein
MSSTDRTFTTRYNILRGQLIYNFHVQNPTRQLEGRNTPASIVTIMNNAKATGSCCPTSTPTCIPNDTNLVQNGDFATGNFSAWNLQGADPDPALNKIITTSSSPDPLPSPAPAVYGYAAGNIGSNATLTQNISTTVGQTYTLSYYLYGGVVDGIGSTIYFSASISGTPITGSIIIYTSPPGIPPFGWYLYSFVFTASSISTPLTFTTRHDANYLYITNISVTATCS